MKEFKKVVYEKKDYETLKNMSKEEVIEQLDSILDGWLGHSSYYGQDDYEGDESDFRLYKIRMGVRKAIEIIEQKTTD